MKNLANVLLAVVMVVAVIVVAVRLFLKNQLTDVLNAAVMPMIEEKTGSEASVGNAQIDLS